MRESSEPRLTLAPAGENRYCLEGELSFSTAEEAIAAGRGLPLGQALSLDLSSLGRVDSAGLAVILEWWRQSRHAGGSLKLEGLSEQVRKLIAISELEPVLLA